MYLCAQVKLLSLLSGKDSFAVSEDECSTELEKMTTDMVKAFDYSEGKSYWGSSLLWHSYNGADHKG